ncbi:MAG: hypothetical protein ACRCY8_02965 [Dermatophilaceae bacterium]
MPQRVISTAASAQTSGDVSWLPMWVPAGTYDAVVAQVAAAQVGGATETTMAVYGSGTDGKPLLAGGPVRATVASTTLLAAGNRAQTLITPLVVAAPTLYWVAVLYRATTAPTTVPTWHKVASGLSLPRAAATPLSAAHKGYYIASLAAMPSTGTLLEDTGTRTIVAALRRSA